jgi:hypothetical protein
MTSGAADADIEVRDNEPQQRFEVFLEGGLAGFAAYELKPAALSILHVEIDPAFEGRGLASSVMRAALESAKARGLNVLPYCPFAKHFLQKHREYVELVPLAQRARFELPSTS